MGSVNSMQITLPESWPWINLEVGKWKNKRLKMPLELNDLKQRLKEPEKKHLIRKAINHESRLKFHCKTTLSKYEAGFAVTVFLDWVKSLLTKDKYAIFLSLFQFPVATIPTTNEIFEAFAKVFEGRDPVYKYEFTVESLAEDWTQYKKQIKGNRIWSTQGMEAMRYAINSVVVVDLPREQENGLAAPYFYFLDISNVIEFQEKDEDLLEWIVYKLNDDEIAVLDDTSYSVYKVGKQDYSDLEEVISSPHELGYCPARFFWSTPMDWNQPNLKKSPITAELSRLDWLLFSFISKRHLDLYAPYPVYSGYETNCEFTGPDGSYCDGGYLRNERGVYILNSENTLDDCPKCSARKLTGPGTYVTVPLPDMENGGVDMRNPIQVLHADIESLKYNREEIEIQAKAIFEAAVGSVYEAIDNQAINSLQVQSLFESRKAVLNRLKENFESIQAWTEETICRLRYGSGFSSASISYGTEFFLFSAEHILQMYNEAREAKLDFVILDMLQEQYYETKFRNNPDELQRSRILTDLDPFRHLTPEEAKEMYRSGLATQQDYILKANFSTLINRFERENMNVLLFADGQEYSRKIDLIKAGLYLYIPQEPANRSPEGVDPEGQPALSSS